MQNPDLLNATSQFNLPLFSGVSWFRFMSFQLPLNDAGSGAVNLVPARAVGSPTPTFTRASTAWTKLASGLWTSVASGTARSAYIGLNTAVGGYGGYLNEDTSTQLVTPTASIRDMTDASWVKVTMAAAKTATGIDGVVNSATTITATGAAATILQTLVAAATSRTYSCWIKRRTGTGTVIIQQGVTTLDVTAQINSATFTQVQLNASVLNAAYGIQLGTNGDQVDVDFNQFEALAVASTPLDTAGGVRNRDLLTYATAGNINGITGTAYAEITTLIDGVRFISTNTGTPDGIPMFSAAGALTLFDGSNRSLGALPALPNTTLTKLATSWGGVTCSGAIKGVLTSGVTFSGNMGISAVLAFGSDTGGGTHMLGTIKNVRIFTRQLPNSVLQSMTT